MSKEYDRKAIMARAWERFGQMYGWPRIGFADIGRPCFAWALGEAWREAREEARQRAIPTDDLLRRKGELALKIDALRYLPLGMSLDFEERPLKAELEWIGRELARREAEERTLPLAA